jgi:aminopeptidase N
VSYYAACYGDALEGPRSLVIPPQSTGGNWGREGLVVAALMQADDPVRNFAILSHELGHSWWGLAVRFDFRADLWLAEGLTEFSASRARFHLEGEEVTRARLERMMRDYGLARETGIPLVACRQESPYSEFLREDGGTVFLTQLRLRLGAADFDRRLRRFYQEHTGATATTADFIRAMTSGAPPGTEAFVHDWITKRLPEVTVEDVLAGLR